MTSNDKMTCARCGHKTSVDLLKWAWVFLEGLSREYLLVCPKCAKEHAA